MKRVLENDLQVSGLTLEQRLEELTCFFVKESGYFFEIPSNYRDLVQSGSLEDCQNILSQENGLAGWFFLGAVAYNQGELVSFLLENWLPHIPENILEKGIYVAAETNVCSPSDSIQWLIFRDIGQFQNLINNFVMNGNYFVLDHFFVSPKILKVEEYTKYCEIVHALLPIVKCTSVRNMEALVFERQSEEDEEYDSLLNLVSGACPKSLLIIQKLYQASKYFAELENGKDAKIHLPLTLISFDPKRVQELRQSDTDTGQTTNEISSLFSLILENPERHKIVLKYKALSEVFMLASVEFNSYEILYKLIKVGINHPVDNNQFQILSAVVYKSAMFGNYLPYRIALHYGGSNLGEGDEYEEVGDLRTLYEYKEWCSKDLKSPIISQCYVEDGDYHLKCLVDNNHVLMIEPFDEDSEPDDNLGANTCYQLYKQVVDAKLLTLGVNSLSYLFRDLYPKEDIDHLYESLPVSAKALADKDMDWFRLSPEIFFEKKVDFVRSGCQETWVMFRKIFPSEIVKLISCFVISGSLTYKEQVMIAASRFKEKDVAAVKIEGIEQLSEEAKECIARLNAAQKNLPLFNFESEKKEEIKALLNRIAQDNKRVIRLHNPKDNITKEYVSDIFKIFPMVLRHPKRDEIFEQYKTLAGIFMLAAVDHNASKLIYQFIVKRIYQRDLYEHTETMSPLCEVIMKSSKLGKHIIYRIAMNFAVDDYDMDDCSEFQGIADIRTLYEFLKGDTDNYPSRYDERCFNYEWFEKSHYQLWHLADEAFIRDNEDICKTIDQCYDTYIVPNRFPAKDALINGYMLFKQVVDAKLRNLGINSLSYLFRDLYPKEDIDILYHSLPVALKNEADQDMDWFRLSPEIFFEKKVSLVKKDCRLVCVAFYKALPRELIQLIANFVVTEGLTYKEQVMVAASNFKKADVDAVNIEGIEKLSEEARECIARLNAAQKNLSSSWCEQL